MRQEIKCKFVTRRRQNGVSSRCRIRVGGSECLEKGSIAVGWQKTQLVGLEQEASWNGAVASCLPRERCLRSKRGEDGGRRKPVEDSQLERANRHTPVRRWGRERGVKRTGWMVGRGQRKWGSDELNRTAMITTFPKLSPCCSNISLLVVLFEYLTCAHSTKCVGYILKKVGKLDLSNKFLLNHFCKILFSRINVFCLASGILSVCFACTHGVFYTSVFFVFVLFNMLHVNKLHFLLIYILICYMLISYIFLCFFLRQFFLLCWTIKFYSILMIAVGRYRDQWE